MPFNFKKSLPPVKSSDVNGEVLNIDSTADYGLDWDPIGGLIPPGTFLRTAGDDVKTSGTTSFRDAVFLRDPILDARDFSIPPGMADGPAFNDAIATITTGNNGATVLTKGHQTIDETILIQDRSGVVITGTSPRGDSLASDGMAGDSLVQVINSYMLGLEHVWLQGEAGARPFALFESKVDASQFTGHPDAVQPTRNQLRDFWIGSDTPNNAKHGILYNHVNVMGGSGGDQGNDQSVTLGGTIYNVEKGIRFGHSQSVSHDIAFTTFGNGVYGVSTEGMEDNVDAITTGGQFRWYGGTMLQLTGSCFHMPNVSQLCSINGLLSEGCARLVLGGTSPGVPLSISNVIFSCDGVHADGRVVNWQGPGPVTIGQSEFKNARETSPGSGTYVYPKFYITTNPYTAKLLVQGTAIVVDLADVVDSGGPNERYQLPVEWGTLPAGSTFVGIGNQFNDRDGQPLPGGTFEVWMDGAVILELLPDGTLAGSAIPGTGAPLILTSPLSTDVTLTLKGAVLQSADPFRVVNNSNAVLAGVTATGGVFSYQPQTANRSIAPYAFLAKDTSANEERWWVAYDGSGTWMQWNDPSGNPVLSIDATASVGRITGYIETSFLAAAGISFATGSGAGFNLYLHDVYGALFRGGGDTPRATFARYDVAATVDITRWSKEDGTILHSVTAAGFPKWADASTIVAFASAPATAQADFPNATEFLKVVNPAGTTRLVPAYAS